MYFPTGTARKFAQASAVPLGHETEIISLAPSPRRSLFCTVTRDGVALWRVRVRRQCPYPASAYAWTLCSRRLSLRTSRAPPPLSKSTARTKLFTGLRTPANSLFRSVADACFAGRSDVLPRRQTSRISFSSRFSTLENMGAHHTMLRDCLVRLVISGLVLAKVYHSRKSR